MELKLENLNKNQKQAVTHGQGPVLIVAGAGTGKTTVITKRFAHLIEQVLAKPEEILALTFTDKAAEEMEERIDRLLPIGYLDLWISTFHSFCRRILEEHGLDIGLSADFKLLEDTARWLLVRQNLEKFELDYYQPLGNPTRFIHALIAHFSRCKDQGVYPQDYLKHWKENEKQLEKEEAQRIKEVARSYSVYQALLLENGFLDFGDLINYCLKLLEKRPLILKEYREKFKYFLVDEFQDTNWAQYQLVKLLAAPENNLTVCADDDQAIYRFRGASFGNIIQFRQDFPKAKQIFLNQNYRSSQDILNLSYDFIRSNKGRLKEIDKKLVANRKEEGIIEHLHFKSLEQEVRGVINKIIELLNRDKEASFNDFVILVRSNNSANPFSRGLERANLPYQFMALRGLYSKPIILDIISYFKLLDDYHESAALYRILNLVFLKISAEDIARISRFSSKKSQSIYQSLEQLSLISGISQETTNKINFILSLIKKHTNLAREKNVSEIFTVFLEDSGYLEYLTKEEKQPEINFLNQFYEKIKAFEDSSLDSRLRNFMEELDLELESGEQGKLKFDLEQGPEMIRLLTVHAAKGLEFKYVFLVNLVDKRFPTIERKEPIQIPSGLIKDVMPEGNIHLEEERRLFYVGMTRAKRGLFFASAEDYGGARKKKPSRFLEELSLEKEILNSLETAHLKDMRSMETQDFHPTYFSFTQFRAFENCPLQYKFAHVLKIPVRGKATFSYGKTIHNALFEFLEETFKKELGLEELLKIYEKEWIDEWYDSQEQKQRYFEKGKKALESFYNDFLKEKSSILFFKDRPALEQTFSLKINGDTVIGKIDRIDELNGGVELIDYKTGAFKEKLNPQDKEQLFVYQIAAEQIFGLKPQKLTYYYLDEPKKLSFLGSQQDTEKQKQKMVSQIEKIKKSDFSPTPGWQCKFCDFKNICEHASNI